MSTENGALSIIDKAKEKFETACKEAQTLQVIDNFGSAFVAVNVVKMLREALTDEVMKEVFMPLMNTKVGFLTDRTGRPDRRGNTKPLYSIAIVRDAIIECVAIGLAPVGNQMNIIAERMYPTKEGYTALLRKINCKYFLVKGYDKGGNANFAEIPITTHFEENGEKKSFQQVCVVKKDDYSSHDQLQGKAERKAKKTLYEYITGHDHGDADTDSSIADASYEDVTDKVDDEIANKANSKVIPVDSAPEVKPIPTVKPQAPKIPQAPQALGAQPTPDFDI